MGYKKITEGEKATVMHEFLKAQEMDHFCHTINAERYTKILLDPDLPEGDFKDRVVKLLAETEDRLLEVELIIKHTSVG